jgi:hypothetical protein
MKQKSKWSNYSLDEELLNLFQEIFSPEEYETAVTDAKKAFSFIRNHEQLMQIHEK